MIVKDCFLTQEIFEIREKAGILRTDPVPEDLERYYQSEDYLSHKDKGYTFFYKIYQWVKSKNIAYKKGIVQTYHRSGNLLDYGCGTGDFLVTMADAFQVNGAEPNAKAVAIANKKGLRDTQILHTTALSSFANNSFEVITLWHVLEHVRELEYISSELKRILKPNGVLIIAVPNYESYDAKYYGSYWAAYDVPRHLWHFSKESLTQWWKQFNLTLIDTHPLKWDAYYIAITSEQYQTKNKQPSLMNYLKGSYRGFISNMKATKTAAYSSNIYVFKYLNG